MNINLRMDSPAAFASNHCIYSLEILIVFNPNNSGKASGKCQGAIGHFHDDIV